VSQIEENVISGSW